MVKKNKNTIILTSIIILVPILVGLVLWNKLPDTMATHFGIENEANRFSSKLFAVVGIPIILLAIHLLCAITIAKDPRKQNISHKMYSLVLWIVPCVSIFVEFIMYAYNLGMKVNINLFANIFIGVIFVVVGNYLPKARQNYTIGIKLPWTLANEENWNKTHRVAGFLWVIAGIVMLSTTFVSTFNSEWVVVGAFLTAIIIPSIYSFYLHIKRGL